MKKVCIVCGKELGKSRQKYCSYECSTESQRKALPTHRCKFCNEIFLSRDPRQKYCSQECAKKAQQVPKRACQNCGKMFKPSKPHIQFCGRECSRIGQKRFFGQDNHFWIDGSNSQTYYGSNWRTQRERALKRDKFTCQRCGVTRKQLNRDLDIHHKIRFKEFDGNWKAANRLNNLISLCPSCHRQIEHEERPQ